MAYFKDINNYIYSIDFQICFSTTLRDETVGNPWAVYPTAKVCFGVPWYYSVGLWMLCLIGKLIPQSLVAILGGADFVFSIGAACDGYGFSN